MMHYLNNEYHDRGMMKWMGFYLSDHTAHVDSETAQRNTTIPVREQMSFDEISAVISEAVLKNKHVNVQANQSDLEHRFSDDIIGPVSGYDQRLLYVKDTCIAFEDIRHIKLVDTQSWIDF